MRATKRTALTTCFDSRRHGREGNTGAECPARGCGCWCSHAHSTLAGRPSCSGEGDRAVDSEPPCSGASEPISGGSVLSPRAETGLREAVAAGGCDVDAHGVATHGVAAPAARGAERTRGGDEPAPAAPAHRQGRRAAPAAEGRASRRQVQDNANGASHQQDATAAHAAQPRRRWGGPECPWARWSR